MRLSSWGPLGRLFEKKHHCGWAFKDEHEKLYYRKENHPHNKKTIH